MVLNERAVGTRVAISPVPLWLFLQPAIDMSILEYVHQELELESLADYVASYIQNRFIQLDLRTQRLDRQVLFYGGQEAWNEFFMEAE